ncbi:A/G-specific adenine glycosylase [Ramlibacter sp.]|uniref:A/G-specific adenine glycosylase n=1 Tax=Ramlibacter sp. TaxID=1917967 RepID=UPI0035AF5AC8
MTAPAPAQAGLPPAFARHVIQWQARHGRHGLPWQGTRDPYRVWLSEVMLQQTQVTTVLGLYSRFLARFPDVRALAAAPLDDVLALWSGLGYYSRARNLHRCAQAVAQRPGAAFPATASELEALPGIGPSTAAAIAAFCFGERVAIFDGNVQRVLARLLAFEQDLAQAPARRALHEQAQRLLPTRDLTTAMPAYTQGLMDLGATVCLPRKPLCGQCPVQRDCEAARRGEPEAFPRRTRKLKRSAESMWLLVARRADGAVWLQRRPARGVWASLHALPAFADRAALVAALPVRLSGDVREGQVFVHVLTHKDLHLHPVYADLPPRWRGPGADDPDCPGAWQTPLAWPALGLPTPVRRLLEVLA